MKRQAREIAGVLREAGYPLVQIEVPVPGYVRGALVVDVLAFEASPDGDLRPAVAVELADRGTRGAPQVALAQLAAIRDILNTRDHYVISDGRWLRADGGLRSLEPVSGPEEAANGGAGVLKDRELAAELLSRYFWDIARTAHRRDYSSHTPGLFVDALSHARGGRLVTSDGDRVQFTKESLWYAARQTIDRAAARDRHMAQHFGDARIARIVASLLGNHLSGTILDPFCGTGGFLWAAMDRAESTGADIAAHGNDLHEQGIAGLLASLAPFDVTVSTLDAFRNPFPPADVVVSEPPLGLRLQEPYELLNGQRTHDSDVAAIDVSLRSLHSGGRAVLHLSKSFTFRRNADAYRRFLATEFRVGAVIGLPQGTFPGTGIPSVLLVIDAAPSGDTFVAQLTEDWNEQLGESGAALKACLAHLDGAEAGASL